MWGAADTTDAPTDVGSPNHLMELPLTDTSRREYSICCEVGTKGAMPGRLSAAATTDWKVCICAVTCPIN